MSCSAIFESSLQLSSQAWVKKKQGLVISSSFFYKEKNHSLGFQLFTKFGDILPEAAAIAMAAMSNTFVPTLATAIKADPKVVGGSNAGGSLSD